MRAWSTCRLSWSRPPYVLGQLGRAVSAASKVILSPFSYHIQPEVVARWLWRPHTRHGCLFSMRACIRTVKTLLAGDAVDFQGTPGRLGYAIGRDIPVLMAASGPKAIELAGEIADGVLLLVGFTPGIVDVVLTCLEQGARRSGRRLEDLEIVWAVRTGTASTTAEAGVWRPWRRGSPRLPHAGPRRLSPAGGPGYLP